MVGCHESTAMFGGELYSLCLLIQTINHSTVTVTPRDISSSLALAIAERKYRDRHGIIMTLYKHEINMHITLHKHERTASIVASSPADPGSTVPRYPSLKTRDYRLVANSSRRNLRSNKKCSFTQNA